MPDSAPNADFAAATMMRLIAAGLARQGLSVTLRPLSTAHVPRREKQDLLGHIYASHGARAICALADAAPHMPPEPVVEALRRAKGLEDLMQRWQRMERFSHGRHRVLTDPQASGALRLTHQARDTGPAPSAIESLLVVSLIAILAEGATSGHVALHSDGGAVLRRDGAWQVGDVAPAPGPVLLRVEKARADGPTRQAGRHDAALSDLRERIVADPLRRWSVAEIAADAGLSPRTLQRRLATQSLSVSSLIAEARLQVAAGHLCDPDGPGLAEIGFLAGYSDQAHFARAFHRAVGTTPRAYRADFRA
ncbi:AraC-like DNA-binding protein [Rubricella aquisinus]|uniref:AraC-like DNA-binding protein n=1 Tax=Rubricella aquisinus TaxID=2028108 RepID=A0A840WLX4_9RHOB|nr:AraC family transcriptional regulator [Rubricella aquisinus]MBB5516088.1 AraC-like DNA-binding protein [Rubricella aquisinus]